MTKDYLRDKSGKLWLTDKGEKVPKVCPKCGSDVGIYLRGEPVFLCKGVLRGKQHYFGTLAV